MNNFRVAGAQIDIAFADKATNFSRMKAHIEKATSNGARLIAFPECALTGYCFESIEEAVPYAETIPGPATEEMAALCKARDCFVIFGLLELDGDRLFNACTLVGPAGVVGTYRKIHLPYLGIDRFTMHGDRPFAVDDAGPSRVGMNICYDGAFPESARVMALMGADLIVLPTNWPRGAEATAAYVINARALENHIYYMAVNRVGTELGFRFIGQSKICDPTGATIIEAGENEETVLYADIDLDAARDKHVIRVPKKHEIWRFADRRPEMYGTIAAARPETGQRKVPE